MMKELILVMLVLCFFAIMQVNDTLIEVNSTPEKKLQLEVQKKMELQAEEYLEKERMDNEKRLLSLAWSDVDKEEKIPWVMFKVINWEYAQLLLIAFIVVSFPFLLSSYKERNRY